MRIRLQKKKEKRNGGQAEDAFQERKPRPHFPEGIVIFSGCYTHLYLKKKEERLRASK